MSAVLQLPVPDGQPVRPKIAMGPVATSPVEATGVPRDAARMLVASPRGLVHATLRDLPAHLVAGDVVVVNTSRVVPASLPARRSDGSAARIHLSTSLPGGFWLVEPRRPHGHASLPHSDMTTGEALALPEGGRVSLLAPFAPRPAVPSRLWLANVDVAGPLVDYLDHHGRPIRYGDPDLPWPLSTYQTVFAGTPGSAESPSAGRGFTGELVARLVTAGVGVVGLTLHCGVSSPEAHEPPSPERYDVPPATARAVNAARAAGRRIVAIGTTVVRALETVVDDEEIVHPGAGWTEHIVRPDSRLRAVDALLTGWHEPTASHLDMLRAISPVQLLVDSYAQAAAHGYRWHELGDVHLLLP